MSYWVSLLDEKDNPYIVERHTAGGTHVPRGTTLSELNITYNYSPRYKEHNFSLKDLQGQIASNTIDKLTTLVEELGTETNKDNYWDPCPGNAGHALSILLKWAKLYPDGRWEVL